MKAIVFLVGIMAVVAAYSAVDAASSPLASRIHALPCATTEMRVTLRVFSGAPDPEWMVRGKQLQAVKSALMSASPISQIHVPQSHKMGYNGFVLSCIGASSGVLVQGARAVEAALLATGESMLSATAPAVLAHVRPLLGLRVSPKTMVNGMQHVRAWPDMHAPGKWLPLSSNSSSNDPCDSPPVVGPDAPPIYDPNTDDDGCFIEMQDENNCYAYGSDIVTNTFPQPGRGSGQKWTENTCEDMGAAAGRDGMVWYGTTLPKGQPSPQGHYAALLIWPDTNFHWIRRDNQTGQYWSHKPGGTPVTNIDNNGNLITDPSQSDFSPWTQFCGYYIAVPTNLTIN